MKHICPICGYNGLYDPAYNGESGSLEFCQCCGFQFGWTDHDQGHTHEEWRKQWIAKGMTWDIEFSKPPENWDPKKQLLNIGIKL
jgi:hypothetical protein